MITPSCRRANDVFDRRQLPAALAGWLRKAGHEAVHVEDVGLRDANDGAIWRHALQTGAAIITKDENFAATAQQKGDGPAIVWLGVGNATNRVLRLPTGYS